MNQSNKIKQVLPFIYIAVEAVLFVFILFIPAPGLEKKYFNYSVIILNFLFSLVFINKNKYNFVLSIALSLTSIADLFLVVLHKYNDIAMGVFSLAQISYGVYLYLLYKNKIEGLISLIARLALSLIIVVISIIVLHEFNLLAVFSLIYFVNLLCNIVFSFIHFKEDILLPIGFVFFLFCDIIVGITSGYQAGLINAPGLYDFIVTLPFDLTWFFYIISQLFIVLSVVYTLKIHHKE